MIWFKACPRCQRGDLALEVDQHGRYFLCLQCGHTKEVEDAHVRMVTLASRRESRAFKELAARCA